MSNCRSIALLAALSSGALGSVSDGAVATQSAADPTRSSEVSRSIDGQGNNEDTPLAGSTNVRLLRLTGAAYADGVEKMAGASRPGAREISNRVSQQRRRTLDPQGASDMFWIWGSSSTTTSTSLAG